MKDLCIVALAEGRYKKYIGLFTLCARTAYPEYDVLVIQTKPDAAAVKTLHFASCERYLLDFSAYKYVYITDIDMMIMREQPDLLSFHLKEIEQTGLPYSNVPRWHEPFGENRLTGLHFVTREWWDITREARKRELEKLRKGEIGNCKCDDELMLMRIAKESGLTIPKNSNLVIRHHGIHIGTFRDNKDKTLQTIKTAVSKRVTPDFARQWQEIMKTEGYRLASYNIRKDVQIAWELKQIDKYTSQLAK